MNNVSLIHAHSLFSDGGVAYELYKKYNIPYLVAIRNTDINKYFKYGIHLRPYALKILKNASKIIFISNAYKEEVLRKYIPQSLMKNILSKTEIIPNGIDKYWHKNIKPINKNDREYDFSNQNKLKIIYVGVINKNKNLKTTIKALNILKEKGYEIEFTVVGRLEDESFNYEIKQNSFINYVGQKDKTELIHLYRSNHIFLMPSIKETFGLVYVEAMSQGLPVIYTKGQGFDGQFEEGTVGYSVYATDAEDIADKVLLIRKNYDFLTKACIVNVRKFDWEGIANLYIKLYGTI
jgi:glycosyltransferase involved in cell wall biosynthesis